MPTVSEKRRAFRELHAAGCFVMPNPWDVGSARYLQQAGFKALATTSAGFAWAQGLNDGKVGLEAVLAHMAEMSAACDVPFNSDFENGFADDPDGVAASVSRAVATGVAGLSIEDYSGRDDAPLYDFDLAVARIRAARTAIDAAGGEVVLTGRSEGFIQGRPDMDETIRRLRAYAEAGAHCLYAPGLSTREQITKLIQALAPAPVNILVGSATDLTVADLASLGVRRISLGGALARAAWGGFIRAANLLAEDGSFQGLAEAAPARQITSAFKTGD